MGTTSDGGETIQLASESHLSWFQAGGEGRRRLDSQATIQSANMEKYSDQLTFLEKLLTYPTRPSRDFALSEK